jgi:hypothetical protein
MNVAALFAWLITAGGGLILLMIWIIEYDHEFQSTAATRLPVPVVSTHATLAIVGLMLWFGYILVDQERLAWASVAILVVVACLGLVMAARWLGVYRRFAKPGPLQGKKTVPPERNFPVAVVIGHGLFAIVTIVLVVLTAVGGS